jgi:RNA polymerase sigma-70 factor (ECF subfamily)
MTNNYIDSYRRARRPPALYPIDHVADSQLPRVDDHTSLRTRSAEAAALNRLPDNDITTALKKLPPSFGWRATSPTSKAWRTRRSRT